MRLYYVTIGDEILHLFIEFTDCIAGSADSSPIRVQIIYECNGILVLLRSKTCLKIVRFKCLALCLIKIRLGVFPRTI